MMELVSDRTVESVYRTDHPRLWRALFAFTGDREVASEAEAEAYAQALRRGAALDDPAAWIWRSAFRIAAGLLNARRKIIPVAEPDDRVEFAEPVVHLLSCLRTLSAQQRAVVALRYVGELDTEQIAEALATTPGTVRVQLHRAHASLRTILEDTDGR